ncbi:MAG: hypothetical protein ACOYL3_10305 [Desulfuromonadaceae bacterium]
MKMQHYDPNENSVKDRCHLIRLYSQANNLRHLLREFITARQKAEEATLAWIAKYGVMN